MLGRSSRLILRNDFDHSNYRNDLQEPLLPPSDSCATPTGNNHNNLKPRTTDDFDQSVPTADVGPLSRSPSSSLQPIILSRNVPLALYYTFFAFAGRSLWSQSVLATFVYLLQHNYEDVGYITAIMGLLQLLVSFPAGYWADRYRRDVLLHWAAFVGLLAVIVTLWASWNPQYLYLTFALAIWGCYWGMAATACMALFADSIPHGQRSYYFTKRSVVMLAGNTLGPLVALLLFVYLGDEWTVRDCAYVISLGQFLFVPALILSLYFNDDHILPPAIDQMEEQQLLLPLASDDANHSGDEDTLQQQQDRQRRRIPNDIFDAPASSSLNSNTGTVEVQDDLEEECLSYNSDREERGSNDDEGDNDEDESHIPNSTSIYCCCISRQLSIPLLIAASDLINGLASGMSIRYFPIFLVDQLHLGPVIVQGMSVISPIFIALLMHVAQHMSVLYGRCWMAIGFKWIGIAFMVLMMVAHTYQMPIWIICVLYVIRSAFMNSTSALTRSVLMDHVPQHQRGKWSAVESVNMFSWSGSAALGGFVLSRFLHGHLFPLFGVTAFLQFVATMCLIPIIHCDSEQSLHDPDSSNNPEGKPNTPTQASTLSFASSSPSTSSDRSSDPHYSRSGQRRS